MTTCTINNQPVFLGDGPMADLVGQFDPLTLDIFKHAVEGYTKKAVATQGIYALGSSRHDAAAHEAGHAVWYAANGITVTSIKVEPKAWPVPVPRELGTEYWTGLTLTNDPPMALGLSSSVEELIGHAQSFLAGGIGEFLLRRDKFRHGTAADERAMAQVIFTMVKMKQAMEASTDASKLDLIAIARGIKGTKDRAASAVLQGLAANEASLHRVAAALLRHDEIDRKLAAELLKDVKRPVRAAP